MVRLVTPESKAFSVLALLELGRGKFNSAYSNPVGTTVIDVLSAGVLVEVSPNFTTNVSLFPVKPVVARIAGLPGVDAVGATAVAAVVGVAELMTTVFVLVPDKPRVIVASGISLIVTAAVESLILSALTPVIPDVEVTAIFRLSLFNAVKLIVSIL